MHLHVIALAVPAALVVAQLGAGPQLIQPACPPGPPAGPMIPSVATREDDPVPLGGQPGQRASGQQHFIVGMSMKRNSRRHAGIPAPARD